MTLHDKIAILKFLESPSSKYAVPQLDILRDDTQAKERVNAIASASDEEIARSACMPKEWMPSQLRVLKIAINIAPVVALINLAIDCSEDVMQILQRSYPTESAPQQLLEYLKTSDSYDPQVISSRLDEMRLFESRLHSDSNELHATEFAKHGYIPIERSLELDAPAAALSVVFLTGLAARGDSPAEFIKSLDTLLATFLETRQLQDREQAGNWLVERLIHHIKS